MTLSEQFGSLGLMILAGIFIGASFSVYRYIALPMQLRLLIDPLFWAIQALLLFLFLLPVNEGELRLYLFLGAAFGFSFYQFALEKPFMRAFRSLLGIFGRIVRFTAKSVYRLLLYPLFFLLKLAFGLCRMTVNVILKCILFVLLVPLKLLRWFLRLLLPERWRLAAAMRLRSTRTKLNEWFAWIRRIGK
ncbi:MAG: spore cortex biosynthesis protein YabQ [Sporolactobacillus sp.]|jgi:spore cortex biosynthesis protein YabQ|nr:spore cortex biosynthesis protein YabQ [Sporolactobacillus sp.]